MTTAPASVSVTTLTSSGRGNLKVVLDHSRFQSNDPYESGGSRGLQIFDQALVIHLQGRMRKIRCIERGGSP